MHTSKIPKSASSPTATLGKIQTSSSFLLLHAININITIIIIIIIMQMVGLYFKDLMQMTGLYFEDRKEELTSIMHIVSKRVLL